MKLKFFWRSRTLFFAFGTVANATKSSCTAAIDIDIFVYELNSNMRVDKSDTTILALSFGTEQGTSILSLIPQVTLPDTLHFYFSGFKCFRSL